MAKYVVLQVDDDREADKVIDALQRGDYIGLEAPLVFGTTKVVGVFKKPTLFCDSVVGRHSSKKTQGGWTRGLKYGWWVCAICKKPSKRWADNLNAVLGAARNLLDDTMGSGEDPSLSLNKTTTSHYTDPVVSST